jgi:CheY-like chemotaxis protein
MSISRRCTFHQDSKSLATGRGLGCCNLDGSQTICDGDIEFCEKTHVLRKYLSDKKAKEELPNLKMLESLNMKSHYKVLVADDEEPMRKLVVNLLSQKGHQCVTASNGLEALDKIGKDKFDAVIADIVMPEMDGIVLTKELSKHHPGFPVMIMTGYTDEYSAETAIASGAREFINKPFSIAEFIIRFHKMMRDHEILRQIEAKNNEIIFNLQRNSKEKIEELKKEIEKLKNQLIFPYRKPSLF